MIAVRLIIVSAEGEYLPCSTPLSLIVRTPSVRPEISSTTPLRMLMLLLTLVNALDRLNSRFSNLLWVAAESDKTAPLRAVTPVFCAIACAFSRTLLLRSLRLAEITSSSSMICFWILPNALLTVSSSLIISSSSVKSLASS